MKSSSASRILQSQRFDPDAVKESAWLALANECGAGRVSEHPPDGSKTEEEVCAMLKLKKAHGRTRIAELLAAGRLTRVRVLHRWYYSIPKG